MIVRTRKPQFWFASAAAVGALVLVGCGPGVTSVAAILLPPHAELTLGAGASHTGFVLRLAADAPAPSGGFLSVSACVEMGPAGSPCVQDREETPSPFREPEAWGLFSRDDNALLPGASVDTSREALHDGSWPATYVAYTFDEDEELLRERTYSMRFDRGDLLKQTSGTAALTHHVVWSVNANASFADLEDGEQDPSWLTLELIDAP